MKKVIIFGNKWEVVDLVRRMKYEPVLVHDERPANEDVEFVEMNHDEVDERCIKRIVEVAGRHVHGLIVCSEYYVELAALLRQDVYPHLPGLSVRQAGQVRDKLELKKVLDSYGIPTANYIGLSDAIGWYEVVDVIRPPFLIKPRKGVLARDITIIESRESWLSWRNRAQTIGKYYAEEYLRNIKEYCCDTVMSAGKVIAQFPGEYTVSCLESNMKQEGIGVNFPGFMSENEIEIVKSLARHFIAQHGIVNGFCHFEFMHDGNGWKFGEVGCRLPGGFQIPTESLISNTDIMKLYLEIMISAEVSPQNALEVNDRYFGYYLYPKKKGIVRDINASLDYPWIRESRIYFEKGKRVAHEDSSVAMGACVVYEANSIDELKERAQIVPKLVKCEYE